ncbi:MAG: phospho-N-acetylmuramoyl-pentapeptide-transferase [Pelagibacterales bacterium]|nr:phospho-N-acetylmuramoyl-pentapeptide-transferase [Pelagibacterales bacterium]
MLTSLTIFSNLWIKSLFCFVSSYLIGFFSTRKYIKFINSRSDLFQPIRSEGPQTHLTNKKKTPTMGGIFIVLATTISSLIFLDLTNSFIWIALLVFISFSLIGLTDDLMKVIYKNTNGFRGIYKIVIQFALIGAVFLWLGYTDSNYLESKVFLPFGEDNWLKLNMVLFIVFITFVIVGSSNAVNLTDGLDGLVSIPAIINLICLISLVFIAANQNLADNFKIPYISFEALELVPFCFALIGSILAFLTFNLKPAKIFMGDVGSLAIGSVIGLIAIIVKQELVFFVISLLFVIEASSVILQVGSYKIRKKRIFLMAPIHHHFEKLGWSEKQVVSRFWTLSFLFAVCGMAVILVR